MVFQPQFIYRITETFLIPGLGLVLGPDAPIPEGMTIRIGDPVTIRFPDGRTAATRIRDIPMATPNPKRLRPIVLELALTTSDIPIGSEIWTRTQSPQV